MSYLQYRLSLSLSSISADFNMFTVCCGYFIHQVISENKKVLFAIHHILVLFEVLIQILKSRLHVGFNHIQDQGQ